MKASKSNKLRYYYSPELGVMMPVPVIHRLRYWALAVILLVAVSGYIFASMSRTRSEARNLDSEVAGQAQEGTSQSKPEAKEGPEVKPET